MSTVNSDDNVLQDSYGSYVSSPPAPPVPPFPCTTNPNCTANNRICDQHKRVLFVKQLDGSTFEIPYGHWENWTWYKERISEHTGISIDNIRVVFAGAHRDGIQRHSGLQPRSTIHLIERKT